MKKKNPKIFPEALKAVIRYIHTAKSCLIVSHQNPEGDAMGSSIGLALALKKCGKKITVYNEDGVPEFLQFLPGAHLVTQKLDPDSQFDLTFMTDLGERARVSVEFVNHRHLGTVVTLDHHAIGLHEGDINLVLPHASASSVVVFHLLKALKLKKITEDIATNLYCALATDTGSFRYSNTNSEAFRIAADLLEAGADPWLVAKNCFETNSVARTELLKAAIPTIRLHQKGKVASMVIRLADMRRAQAAPDEAEGFIDYARRVEGVSVAVCFRELARNSYKVSFRSNARVNVALLAKKFGGGGHRLASGCTVQGSLKEVQRQIFSAVKKYL